MEHRTICLYVFDDLSLEIAKVKHLDHAGRIPFLESAKETTPRVYKVLKRLDSNCLDLNSVEVLGFQRAAIPHVRCPCPAHHRIGDVLVLDLIERGFVNDPIDITTL
ncbi:MAG: hypothetical protein ACREX3_25260 [Gammaproteobacteria bacterium]